MIPYAAKYRHQETGNKCIILYDVHVDSEDTLLSKQQLNDLINNSKKLTSCAFIIEDMFSYDGSHEDLKTVLPIIFEALQKGARLFPNNNLIDYSALYGLYNHCQRESITVINSEFRHAYLLNARYAAFGMMPEALGAFERLLQACTDIFTQLQDYNDTPALNTYYKKVIASISPSLALLNVQFRKQITTEEKIIFLEAFWNVMVQLLDAYIIHLWYTHSQTYKTVAVYVGGEHAAALEKLMEPMGYVRIAHQGEKFIVDYVKNYRHHVHHLQIKPIVGMSGIFTIFENMVTTWKLRRLHKHCAKTYHTAITKAAAVNLEIIFS